MTNMETLKDLSLAEIMGTHLNEEAVALVKDENENESVEDQPSTLFEHAFAAARADRTNVRIVLYGF